MMKIFPFWACLFAAGARAGKLGLAKPFAFEINLDLPVEQRWVEVATVYKDIFPAMMVAFDEFLNNDTVSPFTRKLLAHNNIPAEYIAELVGIVHTVNNSKVTLDRLLLFQMLYEMNYKQASTGILAVDKDGTVFHGRNFDAKLFFIGRGRAMGLEDVVLDLTWTRNGSAIFSSVNFLGQIGVHTGMTRGANAWSIQQNSRTDKGAGTANGTIENNLAAMQEVQASPHTTYIRRLMESDLAFKDVVLHLERRRLCAPLYLIVAGSGKWEGAVIAADRAAHAESMNNVQVLSEEIGRWFLVQTNDDIWADPEDWRRPHAVQLLSDYGRQGMGFEAMVTVMRTYPVFSFDTAFSWLAHPANAQKHLFMPSDSLIQLDGAATESVVIPGIVT